MTREEVKNAGSKHAQDRYCSGDNPTPRYRIAQIHASRDGFVAGAEWRINSVWHDNNVTPGYDCKVLIEDIYGNVYDDKYDADYNEYDSGIEKEQIKRWAYVKDLIPNKED